MGKIRDLTGNRFGNLDVLYMTEKKDDKNRTHWMCRCDCGTIKEIKGNSLTSGNSKSCGCKNKIRKNKGIAKHDRTGETRQMNNGMIATIIAYRNSESMDIQFENGAIVTDRAYGDYARGSIYCPMLIKNKGEYAEVTNPNPKEDVTFLIDVEDLYILGKKRWCLNSGGYVSRTTKLSEKRRATLHRLIMNPPADMEVDHKNGIRTDNRKTNLRICTTLENRRNSAMPSDNTTGYKGIYYCKDRKKWAARIQTGKKNKTIGRFDTKEEAAKAYNEAAIKYHGEFARLNVIGGGL